MLQCLMGNQEIEEKIKKLEEILIILELRLGFFEEGGEEREERKGEC